MNDNIIIEIITKLLKNNNIEILNLANEKENGCVLSFLYKGFKCYITIEGNIYIDEDISDEGKNFIMKIIIYAQKKANIDKQLPFYNINENDLETRKINNLSYKLLIQIKNHCLFYRNSGIFGIAYLLCEQRRQGNGYTYNNIKEYHNIKVAQQNFANRTQLFIKPFNIFSNEELKTILFYIENCSNNNLSETLKTNTSNIKNTIIKLLKE